MTPSALFVTTVPITLEAFLLPFADHFKAMGWRIDALANGATRNPRITEHFDHRFDVTWSRNPLDPANLIGTAPHVRAIVRNGGYDIVHVHTPIAAFVTRYALRALPQTERPAVIYTTHGFHFYTGQSSAAHSLYRTMERTAARWTDFLVTINAEDYEAARSLGTIDPARVRLIPGIGVDTTRYARNTITTEQIAAIRHELEVAPDAFMVLMVAEFGPVKRHEHVLKALSLLDDDRIVIVFAGDGPLEPAVRANAAALGVTSRVRFAGYRRDIPALLAASDALTLVSEREGLARSVLEAMAACKPVIGTRTRGIVDAVGDDAGWIVDKDDPIQLARAFAEAASSPEEVAERGRAGRVRADERFALPHILQAYEELYREALTSRI